MGITRSQAIFVGYDDWGVTSLPSQEVLGFSWDIHGMLLGTAKTCGHLGMILSFEGTLRLVSTIHPNICMYVYIYVYTQVCKYTGIYN